MHRKQTVRHQSHRVWAIAGIKTKPIGKAKAILARASGFLCNHSNSKPSVILSPSPRRAIALSSARLRVTNDLKTESYRYRILSSDDGICHTWMNCKTLTTN